MLSLLLVGLALAQDVAAPLEARRMVRFEEPAPPEPGHGLTFLGWMRTKASITDIGTSNPLLDGQLIGLLGGINGTLVESDIRAFYVEHRLNGYLTYAPPILDERLALTVGFEIDFAWGDASYGVGGNTGGGFGADQVNLQTQRLMLSVLALDRPHHELRVHLGLQFLADGPWDPTRSTPDDLFRAGGRLLFWGSDAAGIAAYGRVKDGFGDRLIYRVGSYTLHEEGLALPDDVWLHAGDVRWQPTYATGIGLHFWYLRDRSNGRAGVFGVGHTSVLSELQGGPDLDLRADGTGTAPEVDADLFWIGLDAGYNHRLDRGPVGVTGIVLAHPGRLYATGVPDVDVLGFLADAEVRWRYAAGKGSLLRAEALWSSADDPGDRERYTGITTGNSYGIVGALNVTHGTLLLFADPFSINRQVAVVYDASNQGLGLLGLTATVGYDPIPNRLTVSVGGGQAFDGSFDSMGTEINARVSGSPFLFFNLGLQGGVVLGSSLEAPPWIVYGSLDWLAF